MVKPKLKKAARPAVQGHVTRGLLSTLRGRNEAARNTAASISVNS